LATVIVTVIRINKPCFVCFQRTTFQRTGWIRKQGFDVTGGREPVCAWTNGVLKEPASKWRDLELEHAWTLWSSVCMCVFESHHSMHWMCQRENHAMQYQILGSNTRWGVNTVKHLGYMTPPQLCAPPSSYGGAASGNRWVLMAVKTCWNRWKLSVEGKSFQIVGMANTMEW